MSYGTVYIAECIFGNHSRSAGKGNYLLRVIPLHNWLTRLNLTCWGKLGAKARILTHSKVVFRKELNGLKQKTSLSKGFSKRRAAKIFVSRLLEFIRNYHCLDRKRSIWVACSKRWLAKLSSLCWYPKFTSKINLDISLHDWFTWGAMAHCWQELVFNTLKSRFSKSTERFKAEKISFSFSYELRSENPGASFSCHLHIYLTKPSLKVYDDI